MNHPTDFELVEEARLRGDKQAFGLLLQRCQSGALRMAKRMIAHEDTARELVQEAMLEAYLSLASLEKPERFQSWLYGIVLNVCRSYLRRQRYDLLSLESMSGGLEATHILLASHAPDPQTMVEMRELHELVLSAIDTLSPQNQQTVLLYYYEQLSVREISLTLGISMTAVKGRLHKSRRQLAGYFTEFASREPGLTQLVPFVAGEAHQQKEKEMIEVQVVDVIIPEDDKHEHHVVILFDEDGQRLLPIWIGPFEAHNIAIQLLGNYPTYPIPRPLTYDFMANLLRATGAVLEEVQISTLQEITFYATALLRVGETIHEIDARPSDAMALALRMGSKISVAESILVQAGRIIPEKFQGKPPSKGLEQLAAKMEEANREYMATMAKFKEEAEKKIEQDPNEVKERLFAYVFGE
jgi:RNA polymerase sigma factor (sigma-70 family)